MIRSWLGGCHQFLPPAEWEAEKAQSDGYGDGDDGGVVVLALCLVGHTVAQDWCSYCQMEPNLLQVTIHHSMIHAMNQLTRLGGPAKRFDDQAGDLPVLTTTLKEILTGVWEGPESVWRRRGHTVGLSDFAREHSAPHLRQPTGRSLDFSKPSSETWARLIGKEFLWSDPQTEDLDWEPPPMDPQLQAKMDRVRRVLNEGKAGPSTNKPVSAPTPPTPPPTPVGKAATAQDHVLHETPAVPPASRPLAAPAPPAPSPATAQDRAQQRWEVLSKINSLVAEADRIAKRRLGKTDLTDAERLCLQRVRAIITYGAAEQLAVAEHVVEKMGQDCLKLKDQHHHAVRSGNALWSLTMSPTKTDPRQAFKDILKEHPNTRQDACKKFGQWAKVVDRAIRTARQPRTLESDDPSGGSAP